MVQSLLPKFFEQAVKERKWLVVGQPRFEELKFDEAQPLTCKAVFEVYPEFELNSYQGLEVEEDPVEVTDADVDQTLESLRQRAATFEVVPGPSRAGRRFCHRQLPQPCGGHSRSPRCRR